jgi:hypothetical protein
MARAPAHHDPNSMNTFDLRQAAAILKLHPEELRRRAKRGLVPGAKVGRAWVFLESDLVDYLHSLYSRPRQALQVAPRKEMKCHFADAAASGGSTSAPQAGREYADLLGLPTKPSRKNSTTS